MANEQTIALTPEILKGQAGEMKTLMGEYQSLFSSITGTLKNTNNNWSPNLANNFAGKIESTQKGFNNIINVLDYGQKNALASAEGFENLDKTYAGKVEDNQNSGSAPATTSGGIGGTFESWLKKTIGGAGLIGGALGIGISVGEHWNNKDITGLFKDLNSYFKSVNSFSIFNSHYGKLSNLSQSYANGLGIKKLFGLNNIKSLFQNGRVSTASTFKTRFLNNFNQIEGPLANYTKGGLKSACAWIGTGLSAITNGISNYQDMQAGKMDAKRAALETVTETVVDIGKDWLIAAGVTAGLAAAGISAPVVAVGAATAAVSIGADALCKKITKAVTGEEKGLTETISDAAIDLGKAAIDEVKNTWQDVKSLGSKVKSLFSKKK